MHTGLLHDQVKLRESVETKRVELQDLSFQIEDTTSSTAKIKQKDKELRKGIRILETEVTSAEVCAHT